MKTGDYGLRAATPSPTPALRAPIATGNVDHDVGLALAAAGAAESAASQALSIARQVRDDFGAAPNPLHPAGGGAMGVLFTRLDKQDGDTAALRTELLEKVGEVSTDVAKVAKVVADDIETRRREMAEKEKEAARLATEAVKLAAKVEAARAPWWRIWWAAVLAGVAFIVVAGLGGLGTCAAMHYRP